MDQIGLDIDKDFFFYKKQKDGGDCEDCFFKKFFKNFTYAF